MKPASIRKFDWLYLGSVAIGLLGVALNYGAIASLTEADLAGQGYADMGAGVLIAGVLFGIAISLALWFMISVLRIGLAKWLLVVLTAWSVVTSGVAIVTNFDATMVWGLVSTVMTVLAIWFLFQPDATAWFAEKKGGNGAE
ncbi:hypothetical protein [Qipengyuania sp. Mu-71]|jgi:hypothetical protein|uniref:hypothetical protein n=1 Tax=Qipengyuania sp. Mu-71 TaxID=3121477 RepID=UPI002FE4855D